MNVNQKTTGLILDEKEFFKSLFTELRIVQSNVNGSKEPEAQAYMSAAADLNNLNALGFNLNKSSFLKLARDYQADQNMTPLYQKVKDLVPEVEASPMYPNFPLQVKEMDEATFRNNQLAHYFSVYGMKELFSVEVKKGWIPETKEVKERKEDEQLVDLKVIDYLNESEVDNVVKNKLISKKERLTPAEMAIAAYYVAKPNRDKITEIPFKENINPLFAEAFTSNDLKVRAETKEELKSIFKHAGDVLDFLEFIVVGNKYKHLTTSVKRAFVELLEHYGVESLEENLADHRWSANFLGVNGRKRSRNRGVSLIDFLSYKRISKNEEAKAVIAKLRNGELLSWDQKIEADYANKDFDAVLEKLKARPGMYLRSLNRLNSLSVPKEKIMKDLEEVSDKMKTQSIVSTLNNYKFTTENTDVVDMFKHSLKHNLKSLDIPEINGKKVFVRSEFDIAGSKIEITNKFKDGGYVSPGLAVKIDDNIPIIRFFTYWNDKRKNIDIDLHAVTFDKNMVAQRSIGWNNDYYQDGLCHSGDLVTSDSAEYIDINIKEAKEKGVGYIATYIHSYNDDNFSEFDTCLVGLMAASNDESQLYNAKNSFFSHELNSDTSGILYALISLEDMHMRIVGEEDFNIYNIHSHAWFAEGASTKNIQNNFPVSEYLDILFAEQDVTLVEKEEDAEVVLSLVKGEAAKDQEYYSLIDENFFMPEG